MAGDGSFNWVAKAEVQLINLMIEAEDSGEYKTNKAAIQTLTHYIIGIGKQIHFSEVPIAQS